jgi:hypothetical protein
MSSEHERNSVSLIFAKHVILPLWHFFDLNSFSITITLSAPPGIFCAGPDAFDEFDTPVSYFFKAASIDCFIFIFKL